MLKNNEQSLFIITGLPCSIPSWNEERKIEELTNKIIKLKTKVLMICWCFANNGDVAMALRSNGTLSRLMLEQEMRDIGIVNPKISP